MSKESPSDSSDEFSVSNEFATIHVQLTRTGQGERLVIESPRFNSKITLDPVALEGLTWQSSKEFSRYLRNSIGPPEDTNSDGSD